MWAAQKKDDNTYSSIQVVFTRDYTYGNGGEIVTEPFEVQYACKALGFDYDSIEKVLNRYFIIKDSVEWNNYLKEPGDEIKEPDEMRQIQAERTLLSKMREMGIECNRVEILGTGFISFKNPDDRKIIENILKASGYMPS